MSISLTCPQCEKALKVKEELAGRKVKCPGCGGVIAVPAQPVEEELVDQEPVEQEEQEKQGEERPRKKKKKKKKQKDKTGLYIGVGVGVFLLVVGGVYGVMKMTESPTSKAATNPPGAVAQNQPSEPEKSEPKLLPSGVMPPKQESKRVTAGVYTRGTQWPRALADMHNFGLAYFSYASEHGHGPNKLEELTPYFENSPSLTNALKEGWVVVCWGANLNQLPQGSSNTIIAYESWPDATDKRIVAYGDGRALDIFEEDFEKAPRADKK